MHTQSAAVAKGKKTKPILNEPHEGTKIRAVYDLFYANKGKVVQFTVAWDDGHGTRLTQLRDIYGLDIRRMSVGKYCLVGEWFGDKYVDYIAT
jgi:hypothetical protein